MKRKFIRFIAPTLLVLGSLLTSLAAPLGTAFTYQGRLDDGAFPVNGLYDFNFKLFDAETAGTLVGPALGVSLDTIAVSNGVFSVDLDFGPVFNGDKRWLEISVNTNSARPLAALTPRQPLNAAPYALYAVNAGSVAANAVNGAAIANNAVTGQKIANATVVRSVNGLTDALTLAAGANITLGTVGNTLTISGSGPGAPPWLLGGNGGTTAGINFLGTTDNQPLELKVNGQRALRLEPSSISPNIYSPNILGGSRFNVIDPGSRGSVIAGGGGVSDSAFEDMAPNHIVGTNYYEFIGGGFGNSSSGGRNVIGGGQHNTMLNANGSVIGGGATNLIGPVDAGFIGGGAGNILTGPADHAAIAGGLANKATDIDAFIGGGTINLAGGRNSVVTGGSNNQALAESSVIAGGARNSALGQESSIGGGQRNFVNGINGTIAGGIANTNTANYASIGGGAGNRAAGQDSVVTGGSGNAATAGQSTVGGGIQNRASASQSTVSGGAANVATGLSSTVAGGQNNTNSTIYGTIGGGAGNVANAPFSATVSGGYANQVFGQDATISGGSYNTISNAAPFATIGGGQYNLIATRIQGAGEFVETNSGTRATINGGVGNLAYGANSTIGGGISNRVERQGGTVGGGEGNTTDGLWSTVPGGQNNVASGQGSFAAGTRAIALHNGSFAWSDGQAGTFSTDQPNQFAVRAQAGVMVQGQTTTLDLRGNGGIRVAGAGVNTVGPAFTHRATAASVSGAQTTVDHPHCNSRPNAILLVTYNFNPAGLAGVRNDKPTGLYYTGTRWAIYNLDGTAMPVGTAYNILVVNP